MKYKNTTPNNIFAKINGKTVVVAPEQEVISEILLQDSGLTPVAPPVVTPKVTKTARPKPAKTPKNRSVNTNEFTTTDKTKD